MKKIAIMLFVMMQTMYGFDQLHHRLVQADRVVQSQLDNGLTILVCPVQDASTVSIQLWYNVGSKHEKDGERGMAHFIEHMIFKGTPTLSESDIDLVANKLSGNCNAFTWYDFTGYVFDIPSANWDKVLPMMADCMQNCTFQQDHLNSELKAVIQELKMIKDQHARDLKEVMITNIFESHPYHYSTIGFKQDLWSLNRQTLLDFYKKYYTPDNAVMVIVGNVDPVDACNQVAANFAAIPAGNGWNTSNFYVNEDAKSKVINLYRDVQQATSVVGYVVPGVADNKEFELEVLAHVLAGGRTSRLYKKLVDELQLVVAIDAFVYDMFEKGMFFIEFSPKNSQDIDMITRIIQQEIDAIAQCGPTLQEVERVRRFVAIDFQRMLENTHQQAFGIGKYFIARKDPLGLFNYGNVSTVDLMATMQNLAGTYCNCVLRHQGNILPVPQSCHAVLQKLQEESDEQDKIFLGAKQRITPVQGGLYVNSVTLQDKKPSHYKQPELIHLDNGMDVMWLDNQNIQTVEIQLYCKADALYDQPDQQGIASIVADLLLEGTQNYPGQLFADELASYGILLSTAPGKISMTLLKDDLEKGLELLTEMLTNPDFQYTALEKIKNQASMALQEYWDTPRSFNEQLARQTVYQNHPYGNIALGTQETIAALSLQDCIDYYQAMITPQQAILTIVGNIQDHDMQDVIETTIGQWQGPVVDDLVYPQLSDVDQQEIDYAINRDQIVLAFAGLSVDRFHEDYYKILLFDQILMGSVVRSMSTRIFQLRQQSGLFYTYGGSLLYGATDQPGMIFIKTIVSQDRIDEAQQAFLKVIDHAIEYLPQDELDAAKRIIINSFDQHYDTNGKKASTFAFLKKYDLPFDYFEKQIEVIQNITAEQVQDAVIKILSSEKLAVIKIGRV